MIGPFLMQLVEEPEVLANYLRDPEGAMDAAALSDSEREIIRSGSLTRLREALQQEYPDREVFLGNVPPFIGAFGHVPQVFGHVPQAKPPELPDDEQ